MTGSVNSLKWVFEEYAGIDKRLFFALICVITFLLLVIKKNFIESEIAAFEILEQRGQMGFYHLVNGLQYLSVPLVYLFKFTVIAFVLWIGCFMFGYKVSFPDLWKLVMLGEMIFFAAEIVKIGWFLFIRTDPDIWDIRAFYPFSLINLVDYSQVNPAWIYPLKSLNLFEMVYWLFLGYGIQYLSAKKLDISFYIVFSSYVLFFLLWLVFFALVYK